MLSESKIKDVKFVTDEDGRKTAVIMPIERYEEYLEMLEDLHLTRVYRETKDEESRPFSEFLEEMRAAGEVDV